MRNDDTNHSCLQPSEFYACECLFDKMVNITFSQIRCHEEIIILLTNYAQHFYSIP